MPSLPRGSLLRRRRSAGDLPLRAGEDTEGESVKLDELQTKAKAATPGERKVRKTRWVDGGIEFETRKLLPLNEGPLSLNSNFPSGTPEGDQMDREFEFLAATNPATVLKLIALIRDYYKDHQCFRTCHCPLCQQVEGDL